MHSLRVDSAIAVEGSTYADSMPGTIGWGRGRSSVMGGPEGSVVSHRVPEGHDVVFFACDGTIRPRQWSWAVPSFASQKRSEGREATRGDVMTSSIDVTEPRLVGAGELKDDRLLWLETRMRPTVPRPSDPDDLEGRTYFHLVDSTGVRRGYVPGHLVLQDLRAGWMLLSTTEPWPQVVVVARRLGRDGGRRPARHGLNRSGRRYRVR
jgi:hypothetical protein